MRTRHYLWLPAALWLGAATLANAQAAPPSNPALEAAPAEASPSPQPQNAPETDGATPESPTQPEVTSDAIDESTRGMPYTIGGMPEAPTEYEYTSPLKRIGFNMTLATYVLTAGVGFVYLLYVLPTQVLFGDGHIEPVMPWLLLPIAGPFIAQYEDSVKDSPGWRALLIADSALQVAGIALGLLGVALSGTRTREPEASSRVELRWGVAGAGLTGVSVIVRTL